MKHKVSELEGALLDAAVAKALGHRDLHFRYSTGEWRSRTDDGELSPIAAFSTDWAAGGPIIEREGIDVEAPCKNGDRNGYWYAYIYKPETAELLHIASGSTPLIAAMRAFVASKLGEEVEL